MRDHYDFSDSIPNPYAKKLKKQITIRLDEDVRLLMREDQEDLVVVSKRAGEPEISHEDLLNDLKSHGKIEAVIKSV